MLCTIQETLTCVLISKNNTLMIKLLYLSSHASTQVIETLFTWYDAWFLLFHHDKMLSMHGGSYTGLGAVAFLIFLFFLVEIVFIL